MRKLLLAAVAIGLVGATVGAHPARAADGSTWTGWYIGGNIGAAFDNATYSLDPSGCFVSGGSGNCGVGGATNNPLRTFSNRLTNGGLVGGGQVGYNYQLTPWFVAGVETDFNYNGVRPTDAGVTALSGALAGTTAGHSLYERLDWFGTFRGRAGFIPAPGWLLYGTGGLAYGNVSSNAMVGPVECCSNEIFAGSVTSKRLLGWTAGAGVERRLGANWSIKAEYLYVDLGSLSYTDNCITARSLGSSVCAGFFSPPTYTTNLATREHVFRLGVNYHFDPVDLDRSDPPHLPMRAEPTTSRLYGGADYLLWWAKGAPLGVPLVSTGPIDTTHHGWLINSDTTILYGASFAPATGGNDTQNFRGFSGTRLTLGYWLNDAQNLAVEAGGFALQTRTAGFYSHADSSGNPVLNIPVYTTIPYSPANRPANGFPGEDGLPAALPMDPTRFDSDAGITTGGINIVNKLQFWGADAVAVAALYRGNTLQLWGLGGFRYLNLAESFNLTYDSEGVSGIYTGETGQAFDQFATRNQFYGATLGLRGAYDWGPLSAQATARAAVGVSHEVLNVSGGYWDYNYLASYRSGPEGVFAQPANEGNYSSNKLAIVPELQVKFGYNLTPSLKVTVGYDFLYYSNVVRPGDNINRDLPKGQTFQQGGSTTSSTSPNPLFKSTDFYVHGLSVGLAANF